MSEYHEKNNALFKSITALDGALFINGEFRKGAGGVCQWKTRLPAK